MKKTLKARLILWIWGTAIVIFAAILYINYIFSRNDMKRNLRLNAETLARYYAKNFEEEFSQSVAIPRMTSIYLETSFEDINERDVKEYIKQTLKKNPHIYGSTIAFEPYSFIPDKKYFAPYYYNKEGKLAYVQLGSEEYDYFNLDWYKIPKEKSEDLWTEPYFDEGGGNIIMTTYSCPFYYKKEFKGIATVDVSLMKLTEEISKENVSFSGYVFIVSKKGVFVSFPDKDQILKGNIYNYNKELAKKMTSGEEGFIKTIEPLRKENSWIIYKPIKGADFSIGIVYPERMVIAGLYSLQQEVIMTGFAGLVVLLIVIIILSNSIVRPLTSLVEAVNRLGRGGLQISPEDQKERCTFTSFLREPAAEEKDTKISIDTNIYEVQTIEISFNNMVDSLKKYIQENQRITIEKERIENELTIAREIQMSVSPTNFPAFPERKDIDIFGKTTPAKEVGGDFFDFCFIDKERLAIVIGDATGKGVPAAIFMAVSRAFLKSTALKGYEPGECLRTVNDLLCSENYMDMFITVFYGVLNTSTGDLFYCNGGHNPPWIVKKDKIEKLEIASGPALGMFEEANYKTVKTRLEKSELIFTYTDGVDEAMDSFGNLFTNGRLKEILEKSYGFSPSDTVNKVQSAVEIFSEGAEQADDITMLAVKRM